MSARGTSQAGASGHPPTAATRVTRAGARATAATTADGKAQSPSAKSGRPATAGEQARHALTSRNCMAENEQTTHCELLKNFKRILDKYGAAIPEDLYLALQSFATLLQENAGSELITKKAIETVAQRMEEKMEASLEKSIAKLSNLAENLSVNQKEIQGSASSLSNTSEALQKVARDIDHNTKEAKDTSTQLTSSVTTYKEALLSKGNVNGVASTQPGPRYQEDPRLTRDLDRKQRQILIEFNKSFTEDKSGVELREKINAALTDMETPPPEGTKVQEINKLRNGGVVLQLSSKEAAAWLREPANEEMFLRRMDTDASIKDRSFPILVPRVPLSFDPNNQDHLREVESVNDLPAKAISKARWIKPEYRRHPKQKFAFATLSLSSATEANRLIRDGMYVCSTRTFPKRLKYEPRQCMKCRKWGHYASECHATINTCGTCGGDHTTRDCEEPNKKYCVACRSAEHASWDRNCPEFQRKSAHFDELHPENALTYFPTDESWTLNARPDKIPLEERFPKRFSVGLPPVQQVTRTRTREAPRRRQRKRAAGKEAGMQGTLDQYMEPSRYVRPGNSEQGEVEQNNEDEERETNALIRSDSWIE
jgi:hypothetical protein